MKYLIYDIFLSLPSLDFYGPSPPPPPPLPPTKGTRGSAMLVFLVTLVVLYCARIDETKYIYRIKIVVLYWNNRLTRSLRRQQIEQLHANFWNTSPQTRG